MSWMQLHDIRVEAVALFLDDKERPRAACPNDGEPLVAGPDGELFCRFDGWREGHVGVNTL